MTYCLSPLDSWIAVSGTGEFLSIIVASQQYPTHNKNAHSTTTHKTEEEERKKERGGSGEKEEIIKPAPNTADKYNIRAHSF